MSSKNNKQRLNDYARYSNMAFQMGAIIVIFTFGGYHLDKWIGTLPLFTIIFSLGGVAIAIYVSIKDLLHKKKQ
ncbi:MAG: AtpZ/AtpI family protein [Bacteroidota bacterium]|nr:AtpZ/AtpI family protein [Bacteroidota bacterium]